MPVRTKKTHPALKHAGYSATTILPGESSAEFDKLHRRLIAELIPAGPLEDDIVATAARLLWRKQNLTTFRLAEVARSRRQQLVNANIPYSPLLIPDLYERTDPAEREEAMRAAEDQARTELGDMYALVEIGETATLDGLMNELEVQDRLDAMIDKCIKRLLLLRGLKSISAPSPSAPLKAVGGVSTRQR